MDTFIFLIFLFAIAAQVYNLYVGAQAWIYLLALLLSIAYAFVSFTLLIQPFIRETIQPLIYIDMMSSGLLLYNEHENRCCLLYYHPRLL